MILLKSHFMKDFSSIRNTADLVTVRTLVSITRTIYERPDLAAKVTHLQFDIQHVNRCRMLNDLFSDVGCEDSDSGEEETQEQGTSQEKEKGAGRLVGHSPV